MAHFVFNNFKVVSSKKERKATKKIEIIQSGIIGKVIEENDTVKVKIGEKTYSLTEDSYDCRGRRIVYIRNFIDKSKHKVYAKYIRLIEDVNRPLSNRFTPFKIGGNCIGDLVKSSSTTFRIRKMIEI